MVYCVNKVKIEKTTGQRTAGKKAPDDVTYYAEELGASTFEFTEARETKNNLYNKLAGAAVNTKNWIRLRRQVKKEDTVLLQHPNEGVKLTRFFLKGMKEKKNVKVIILIHDLVNLRNSLVRTQSNAEVSVNSSEEAEILRLADYIICHNHKMKKYLTDVLGLNEESIICLEIFDYKHDCELPNTRVLDQSITIAGNLLKNKSEYIYKLVEEGDCKIHLYGPNYDAKADNPHVCYHGVMSPDELPGKMEGSFGLVWDGPEITTCAGIAGEYLRFNNPHKCSLYLSSNMPVIIWKEAALAPFVEENGVGITVDNLLDIADAIEELTDEQYAQMVSNTIKIGEQIRSGYYLKLALREVPGFSM